MDKHILLIILISFCQLTIAFHFKMINKQNNNFEKTVAHILGTEVNDTGNNFIILIHSLCENDPNLDLLTKELNNADIPIITFSQNESQIK